MKIAYLILAHNNPLHLERLISSVLNPSNQIFLHIDKKSNLRWFSNIDFSSIFLINNRERVFRADFSQIEATLRLMKQALVHPTQFDRFVLLSGSDYPLRSREYIQNYFIQHPMDECINLVEMPSILEGKPITRLTTYKPTPTQPRYLIERILRGTLRRTGIIPKKRNYKKYFKGMTPYAGAQWWALTRNACTYVLDFVDREKEFVKFMRHSAVPDEMFFQIILGNSQFCSNITNLITFTDWSGGGGHPAQISMEHITNFYVKMFEKDQNPGAGEFLFARKFSDSSSQVIETINQIIVEKGTS